MTIRILMHHFVTLILVAYAATSTTAEENAAIEQRLATTVKYLSSDELEGRGVGLVGLDKAADYIAGEFARLGLKTDLYVGGPFQRFTMTTGAKRGEDSSLSFVAPHGKRTELKLDEAFTPLALGGAGKFDLPLAFVGYGITAKDEGYDDYASIDVKGKAVIILRHEPQQDNPHSKLNGDKHSTHAPFVRKVSNAYEHGAAAVLFVTDEFDIKKNVAQFESRWQTAIDQLAEVQAKFKQIEKPSDDQRAKHRETIDQLVTEIQKWQKQIVDAGDPLLPFRGAGDTSERRDMPVLYCRRAKIDRVLRDALNEDLAAIEHEIDKDFTPRSRDLAGWRVRGEADVSWTQTEVKNVVAVLEGEGPHADETIVIGAHYDHWGRGGSGSADPDSTEIHNGADDNASGTAALIEVARELKAHGKLPRRIVFIAFTGEELGLIGSARYVREPLFPLDKTVAMLNMDMVGRMNDNKLIVYGTETATQFNSLVDRLGKEFGFEISKKPEGFGPSDHSSFYAKQIPVLHYFTGTHSDYHRPSDDFDKLNIPGIRRVAKMMAATAIALAEAPDQPTYLETKGSQFAGGGGDRPYFGSIPDFAQEKPGYALMGVSKGGPAEKAGIKGGDIIVQFGDSKIGNLNDFDSALRKFKAGDKVPVVIQRGDAAVKLEVVLDPPK
jgi:hypothetical protein